MASFNKILLMGNLTRDPQLKYLPNSQTPIVEFGVACNRKFRTAQGEDREEVTFVDITAFGKTGELVNKFFTRGKPIFIEGRLKYDSWEDKQGGGKRSKLTVVAENIVFLPRDGASGGGGGGGGGGGYGDSAPAYEGEAGYDQQPPQPQQRPQRSGPPARPAQNRGPAPAARPPAEPPFGEEQQFKDDDIPF